MSHKKSRHAKDLPAVAPTREGDLTTPSLKPQDEAKLAQLLTKLQPQRKEALVPMSAAKARQVLATPVARRTQPPIETLKALRQVLNSPDFRPGILWDRGRKHPCWSAGRANFWPS